MARIATYSKDTSISNNDLLVGTDADDSNITKNYKIEDLAYFVKGYKDYVFIFTQNSTNDPVVTELSNDTGLTFTFTRNSAGQFRLIPSASLDISKTWVQVTGGDVGASTVLNIKNFETNLIAIINVETATANPIDGVATGFVEIRIYP
jgi:hypothetical protein